MEGLDERDGTEPIDETCTAAVEGLDERDGTEPIDSTVDGAVSRCCRRGVVFREGGVAVLEVETETAGVSGADGSEIPVGIVLPPSACRIGVVSKSAEGTGGTLNDSFGAGTAKYFGSSELEKEPLKPESRFADARCSVVLELLWKLPQCEAER